MWNGKPICRIGERSRDVERRLTTCAPVASLVLRPSRSSFFCFIKQCLLMLALWSCGRRGRVAQAQRQIHRVFAGCLHLAVSDPWLEPIVHCGFDACRTSHSVAASERLTP